MTSPLVTVIIPCFNRASIIAPAIESVRAQTFEDWELVVVDDGSSDNLREMIGEFSATDPRIQLVCHDRNRGEPAARNTGIAAARGRFITFLDSDDEWLPEKLEHQVKAVLAAPDPDNVFCVTRTIVKLSSTHQIIRPLHPPASGRSFAEFLYNDGGFAQSSSFFLGTELAKRFPFREDLKQMVDHLFFMEVGAAGAAYLLVREPLTIWHNEARPDRISMSDSLGKWRATVQLFFESAGGLLPPRARVACEARFLSGILWQTAPIDSLKLLLRARRSRALSTRQIVALFCRNAMSPTLYNSIRHRLPSPGSA
jgi:glycosyltransferase involved in cell wall biosynthesis